MIDEKALRRFTMKAVAAMTSGASEDVLRHLLSANLERIFPGSPWWLEDHILGTERHLKIADASGAIHGGFADVVVGKTAIEYEKNLTLKAVFDEGYKQVREYCSSLCNLGIEESEIYGVLSDTVHWYGYKIHLKPLAKGQDKYCWTDVELSEEDYVDLSIDTVAEFSRFNHFIGKYVARQSSRLLRGNVLKGDFGVDSPLYENSMKDFRKIVKRCARKKPAYYDFIVSVWQNFVAFLGVSDYGKFSLETYISELYLVIVAKVLCANILCKKAIISTETEIRAILDGEYFRAKNIENLVDYDYFGWLQTPPFSDEFIDFVKGLQKRMLAYDFKTILSDDLFGELLAQLADKKHRLLLGQELTPRWIANNVVEACLAKVDNPTPKGLDMCCGSGVFLIELVSAAKKRIGTAGKLSTEQIQNIVGAATGFDIDPLAIMLAKVNWVLSMRDIFSQIPSSIRIPIYHADSLFMSTPVMHKHSAEGKGFYVLHLCDKIVQLPEQLFNGNYRHLFDILLPMVYKTAMYRAKTSYAKLSPKVVDKLLNNAITECGIKINVGELLSLKDTIFKLIEVLESLQRTGRNGIWYFVLNNSYRPDLMSNRFDLVVSNPPWLALSKIANNPYQNSLKNKASAYGILPRGSSFLHVELATIFLVSSVDRYLVNGGIYGCVMPTTVMNGNHHEPFRQAAFTKSPRGLQMSVSEIWELPQSVFKNKAIALLGKKGNSSDSVFIGRSYVGPSKFVNRNYTVAPLRSAWVLDGSSTLSRSKCEKSYEHDFEQGADLFPRTALFHVMKQNASGSWNVSPISRDSELAYLINDSKIDFCSDIEAKGFDDAFVFDGFISKHLSPFYVADPAKVIIPGRIGSSFASLSDEDVALLNTSTAAVFKRFEDLPKSEGSLAHYFEEVINIYGKLHKQDFMTAKWMVVVGASGSNPCAAYIDLSKYRKNKLVVDQTLYWALVDSKQEALYVCGLINSESMIDAIRLYQPEGGFGRRHIHTLPYMLIPRFSKANALHKAVADNTAVLVKAWHKKCKRNVNLSKLLDPNSGSLNSRRRILQLALREIASYKMYNDACQKVIASINNGTC